MYERFTDRMRAALSLAQQEARRLCHEYIGTEHVLLGILKEGQGVACQVMRDLLPDTPPDAVAAKVLGLCTPGPPIQSDATRFPNTPRVVGAFAHAIGQAKALGHNYVGTEHVLLGLLKEAEGVAGRVLGGLGLTAESVTADVVRLLPRNDRTDEQSGGQAVDATTAAQRLRRLWMDTRPLAASKPFHESLAALAVARIEAAVRVYEANLAATASGATLDDSARDAGRLAMTFLCEQFQPKE